MPGSKGPAVDVNDRDRRCVLGSCSQYLRRAPPTAVAAWVATSTPRSRQWEIVETPATSSSPSVNAPATQAYQRLALEIVGYHASLHRDPSADGETAVCTRVQRLG